MNIGAKVFFVSPVHNWIQGTLEEWDGSTGACRPSDPRDGRELIGALKNPQLLPIGAEFPLNDEVGDLTDLSVVHEATVLNCLKKRFLCGCLFTFAGPRVLLSFNPMQEATANESLTDYVNLSEEKRLSMPHAWSLAHRAWEDLRNTNSNQLIIVCGASGSGKSHISKLLIEYISQGANSIFCSKILTGFSVLEAFTSSAGRNSPNLCSKILQMYVDCDIVRAAKFTVLQLDNCCRGLTNEFLLHVAQLMYNSPVSGEWCLEETKQFKELREKGVTHSFKLQESLQALGMEQQEIATVWKVIGSIVLLANVEFLCETSLETSLQISPTSFKLFQIASELMGVNPQEFLLELTTMPTPDGRKNFQDVVAVAVRNELVAVLYLKLVEWLVEKLNSRLSGECSSSLPWVGLFDVVGYNTPPSRGSSLDILRCNVVNEVLQYYYCRRMFEENSEECRKEYVDTEAVSYPSNRQCMEFFQGPNGFLSILEDQSCHDESLLSRVAKRIESKSDEVFQLLPESAMFTVRHHFGCVTYNASEMIGKHVDDGQRMTAYLESNTTSFGSLFHRSSKLCSTREELSLIESLFHHEKTDIRWIRCMKPNEDAKSQLDGNYLAKQLESSALVSTIKIEKAGFPIRIPIKVLWQQFRVLGVDTGSIVSSLSVGDDVQIGETKVFLKTKAFRKLLQAKAEVLKECVEIVQRFSVSRVACTQAKTLIRALNKPLVELVTQTCRKLLALHEEEDSSRHTLLQNFMRHREEVRASFEGTLKELTKAWRRYQLERIRESYDRKQKLEAAEVERKRLDRVRQEIAERRQREKEQRLSDLRQLAEEAQRTKQQQRQSDDQNLRDAEIALHIQLQNRSRALFEQREIKLREDRQKAEAAKARRRLLEKTHQERLKLLSSTTEQAQLRGSLVQLKKQFERKNFLEEQQLRTDIRKQEGAAKLRREQQQRESKLALGVSLAAARYAYMKAEKVQITRDTISRSQRNQLIRHYQEEEMNQMREETTKLQLHTTNSAEELASLRSLVSQLKQQQSIVSHEETQFVMPLYESRKDSTGARVSQLQQTAPQLAEETLRSPPICITSVEQEFKKVTKHPPKHLDPSVYQRLEGSRPQIISKYGTSGVSTHAPHSLPWRR